MSNISRRKFVTTGLVVAAGASGLAVAAGLAKRYGLVPPDSGGIYGPGETLTYAAQRLITKHSLAREFPRSMISKKPFANELASAPPSRINGSVGNPSRFNNVYAKEASVPDVVSAVAGYSPTASKKYFAGASWPSFATSIALFATSSAAPPTSAATFFRTCAKLAGSGACAVFSTLAFPLFVLATVTRVLLTFVFFIPRRPFNT